MPGGEFTKKEDGEAYVMSSINEDEVHEIGRALVQLAISLGDRHFWDSAIQFWELALDSFHVPCDKKTESSAAIAYNIGIIFGEKLNEYDEGIHWVTESLNIRRAVHGENHFLCAQTLARLGGFIFMIGEYDDAKTSYRLALDLIRHKPRLHRDLIGDIQERMGDILLKMSEYNEALQSYTSALLYKQAEFGEEGPELSHLYLKVGECYHELGEKHRSVDFIQKAISLAEKQPDQYDEAKLWSMRGMLCMVLSQRAESLENCQKALTLYLTHHAECLGMAMEIQREKAAVFYSIGCIHLESLENSDAMAFFQESLNAWRMESGRYMPCSMMEVSNTLFKISQAFENQGELEKALEYLEEALIIREEYSPESSLVARTHEKVAAVARKAKDSTKAQASLQVALRIWKKLCDGDEKNESVRAVIKELSDLIDEIW